MKVLNLVTYPRPFFIEQVDILTEYGVEVDILSVPGRKTTNSDDQRSVHHYAQYYATVLRKSISNYDLVHANYGLTVPFALAQPNRPIVASLWGSDLMGSLSWITKRTIPYCDEIIVMSDKMSEKVNQDTHIIPHGVNTNKFKPIHQNKAQNVVGWDQEKIHVLFPYDPTRDVKNYPLAESVVEAVKSKLSKPIMLQTIHGVNHADIPLYMNAADALLLTSHREGFPNSVKEAMACNLPIVSTDVGSIRDRLENVSQSYVGTTKVELINHLTYVLENSERSDGRNHIDDLRLDQMAEDIISVYEKALL